MVFLTVTIISSSTLERGSILFISLSSRVLSPTSGGPAVTDSRGENSGDESEKRMEEEIICNRWKDLADESILHRRSFLAFGNSGYMISSTESLAWRHAGSQSLGSHVHRLSLPLLSPPLLWWPGDAWKITVRERWTWREPRPDQSKYLVWEVGFRAP